MTHQLSRHSCGHSVHSLLLLFSAGQGNVGFCFSLAEETTPSQGINSGSTGLRAYVFQCDRMLRGRVMAEEWRLMTDRLYQRSFKR